MLELPHIKTNKSPETTNVPVLLQKTAMLGMLFLVLLSFMAANVQVLLWQSSDWLVGAVLPAVVVDLTNDARDGTALPALSRSGVLDAAATKKAEHMAKNQYFAHYSPDNVSPWYWFDEVGYVYAHAGENLAVFFSDSAKVVDAWMESPTHRANIVSDVYTEIGVGTARGTYQGHETVFVVQLFGTPAQLPSATSSVGFASISPEEVPTELVSTPEQVSESVTTSTDDSMPEVIDTTEAVLETTTTEPVSLPQAVESDAAVASVVPENKPSLPVVSDPTMQFSGFVATSSGLPVASIGEVGGTTSPSPSLLASAATQPNLVLQLLYGFIGTLVSLLLLVSIIIGAYNARSLQVVYGVALLVCMSGLFYVHMSISGGTLVAAPIMAL